MEAPLIDLSLPNYHQNEELISSLPTKKGWIRYDYYQYQGFWFSSRNLKTILHCQNHFQARHTDIFLVTSPKSGTTWLKAILFALLNRSRYPPDHPTNHPLTSDNPHSLVRYLELEPRIDLNVQVDDDSAPRLIATHLPSVSLPDSVKNSACKLVYLCRNPRDNLVSLWQFMSKAGTKETCIQSLEESFNKFCNGVSLYGPFWDHALGYWKESLENPGRLLFLKYEEMKENPKAQLKRIAEFVGYPISPEEESKGMVDQILELCSFDHLSSLDVNKSGKLSSGHHNSVFFRRGVVGDWKNHLTPEMVKKLDQITQEKWHGSGLFYG